MRDVWNATHEELRDWAYTLDAMYPTEDWHLAVAREDNAELIFGFASDTNCPSRFFFLWCLYLFVGDAWRTEFRAYPKHFIENILSLSSDAAPSYIVRWATRSQALLKTGVGYTYDDWCDGALARREQDASG